MLKIPCLLLSHLYRPTSYFTFYLPHILPTSHSLLNHPIQMRITLSLLTVVALAASAAALPVEKRAADNKLVIGYWVPWGDVPVSAVDFTKYTHIN